jgi:N-acetylmuramoyl-L-alanine amidase
VEENLLKKGLTKASHTLLPVALLGLAAGICGCGAQALPRYTAPPRESQPRLYPLSSSSVISRAPSLSAYLKNGKIQVQVPVQSGETWPAFGRRVLHDPLQWQKVQKMNGRRELRANREVQVPHHLLNTTYLRAALTQVFPNDEITSDGWQHVITHSGESLWLIAETFTGDGSHYVALQKENNITSDNRILHGQAVVIPGHLLLPALRPSTVIASSPAASVTSPSSSAEAQVEPANHAAASANRSHAVTPPASEASNETKNPASSRREASRDRQATKAASDSELVFVQNARGEREAVYRLKKGEALYSSVVVRFTGRIDADEVNNIAQKLLEYNGIGDATRIPDGAPIRIPARFLDEDILRGKIPMAPPAIKPAPRPRSNLHVILDAGHGGNDPGTIVRGWPEDEIAYDLMLRIKQGLQSHGVKIYTTVRDRETGEAINGSRMLVNNRDEYVKVTPEYYMDDSRVALNMRIYLVEDIYRWLLRRGVSPENVVFISIHLDHLHPSVGGTMVYYPAASERLHEFRASGSIYRQYKESRIGTIRFQRRDNGTSETLSYNFSQELIRAFDRAGIPVHEYKPIRRYVYRHDRKWSPGIIRYSRVPTSVLLEAANLSNRGDLSRIRSSRFRQKFSDAVVQTIVEHF